jgi:hypothetical protein
VIRARLDAIANRATARPIRERCSLAGSTCRTATSGRSFVAEDASDTLRGSESRTLATVGAFRVVSSGDLRDDDGRVADPRSGDLRHLREQGLIRMERLDGHRDPVVVLTKEGRSLLQSHRDDPREGRADSTARISSHRGGSRPRAYGRRRARIIEFRHHSGRNEDTLVAVRRAAFTVDLNEIVERRRVRYDNDHARRRMPRASSR